MKKVFKTTFFIGLSFVFLLCALAAFITLTAEGNRSGSVGIIGGADGPTVILVTGSLIVDNPFFWILCAAAALCIAAGIGWVVTKNR